MNSPNKVEALAGICPDSIPFETLFARERPVILKGLVSQWPMVKEAKQSPLKLMTLLECDYSGKPMLVYKGPAKIKARFGYDESCTGFNFASVNSTIPEVFETIRNQMNHKEHDYLYINSLKLAEGFPKLNLSHQLRFDHPQFDNNHPVAKIWLGTESVAAAHFDQPQNIACCIAGKRRFTLFPPDQIANLYPGPLHPTPGGQVVTIANLSQPDYDRFPRLKTAYENAFIADLEPGDALYYPSMWWHEVEAFDRFNAMINFWWMAVQPHISNPMDAMMHAILSIRDRPENEKAAWQALFEYYIFNDTEQVRAHLPSQSHGFFSKIDDNLARRLRSLLRNNLNR